MRISSQLLLTFLLNACWQIALVAAFASLGSWLLRDSSARFRHWVWVSALVLSLLVPAITASRLMFDSSSTTNAAVALNPGNVEPFLLTEGALNESTSSSLTAPWLFQLDQRVAFALLAIFFAFVAYRVLKLAWAWRTTRRIRQAAFEISPDHRLAEVIRRCEKAIPTSVPVSVLCSDTLPVPVTIGVAKPIIILPEELLLEGNTELISSAIGHELVHVARRDYILNLVYEVLSLPISFNPATALISRRIKQTRELCCDEVVSERVLSAEAYARSLVKLASSAPPFTRLSLTTTVGIADADILEARIMSLLKKPKMNPRWRRPLVTAVMLLLLVPCVAAAAFAMRLEVVSSAQDPVVEKMKREGEQLEIEKLRRAKELMGELNEADLKKLASSSAQVKAELEERVRRQDVELEIRAIMEGALVKMARIPMDQAIQIATSTAPGKVLSCNLVGEPWEEPGKLAKDAKVYYRVIIMAEDASTGSIVMVNAIDGTIVTHEIKGRRGKTPFEN